jgi:hypothetical protein
MSVNYTYISKRIDRNMFRWYSYVERMGEERVVKSVYGEGGG